MDHSYREMKIDFFEKNLQNMPTLPNLGDLVIVRDIKVGSYLILPSGILTHPGSNVSWKRVAAEAQFYRVPFPCLKERTQECLW
jgi:hypothetical protein